MNQLIIVGAGGFAKELHGYISQDIKNNFIKNAEIKGFLDISEESFLKMKINSSYLGNEETYSIEEDDHFIIAIGNIKLKEKIIQKLEKKNASFFSYIHSSVFFDDSSNIGQGVIICPFCMVNAQSIIGDFTLMNIYTSVAHDAYIGRNSILSPYATVNGNVKTGKNLFMATRTTILPGIEVGENCIISAGTIVSKNMDNYCMAYPKSRTEYLIKGRKI